MADGSTSHTPASNTTEPSADTSVERNKAVSRRWIDVFNARDDAAEADVRAPDYVAHAPASPIFRSWRGHGLPVVARAVGFRVARGCVVGCR